MACGGRCTLLDLYRDQTALVGTALLPVFASARVGGVKHLVAAIDQARRVLGYKPQVEWRDGLRDTVHWRTNL